MAVNEIAGSRERGKDNEKRKYLVTGSTTPAAAKSAALSYAPGAIGDWPVSDTTVSEGKAQDYYEVTVTWSNTGAVPSGSTPRRVRQDFDFGAETMRLKYTKATQTVYKRSDLNATYDPKGAINWIPGQGAEGVDIFSPTMSVRVTNQYAASAIDTDYWKSVVDARCTTNSSTFWGFAVGEVLFLGATGYHDEGEDFPWTVTFSFAFGKNLTGESIPGITGIAKKAWEHLEVRSSQNVSGTGNSAIILPVNDYAVVSPVYDSSNFSDLNVGDSPFGNIS